MKIKLLPSAGGLLLFLAASTAYGHGMSGEEQRALIDGGNLQYLRLGATHMLTGYDHLLFVFGVVFFLTGFWEIVKYITAFTLGHSITLIFATVMGITANYFLVDAFIALSVCYIGYANNGGLRKYFEESPRLLWVIFVFGLIHGFGLSTRLQQLPLGEGGLILRILSFNLGIELGQIGALLVMTGVLAYWRNRRTFLQFSTVANNGLIAAGAFLFLMQMHGYLHSVHPDEFGFSVDLHEHAHEDREKTLPTRESGLDIPAPGHEYQMPSQGAE